MRIFIDLIRPPRKEILRIYRRQLFLPIEDVAVRLPLFIKHSGTFELW